ncbi:MAG: DUF4154 domain-containing protein [Bacteroidetes bacterium]|nr:DUF4154 domain-containing protein [Bacteroidota bacterium]
MNFNLAAYSRKYLYLILGLFFFNLVSLAQYTQEQLKTAYIFNFAENLKWKNEEGFSNFKIGVLGKTEEIVKELKFFAQEEKIKNKSIEVIASDNIDDLKRSQIIYLSDKKRSQVKSVYDKIAKSNTLLITDQYRDQRYVMLNFLVKGDNRIQFELNEENINSQGITVLPDMLLLGGTEIDVRKLYEESQETIQTKEQQLAEQQKQLDKLQKNIKLITEEIDKQRDLISMHTASIFEKQKMLDKQTIELDTLLSRVSMQREELDRQREIQTEQQKVIDTKREELKEYNDLLLTKYAEVDKLQEDIDEKQAVLAKQNVTIATQQNILFILGFIILLIVALVFAIYRGYKQKKTANKVLKEKNIRIEVQRRELEKSYKQLKELEEFKETMTDMIVHDLKNPLNSIIGLSHKKANFEDLKTINHSGKKMLNLVTDILDIHKFEDSKIKLKLEDHSALEVANEALEEVSMQLQESSIKVVNNIKADHFARYDYDILSRVIMNLMTNSIKYTPHGGTVTLSSEEEGEWIKISVADTGQGIPADRIDSIFDKFSQVKDKKYGRTSSTGLGLTFCKLAVEAHGGRINVSSVVGEGSVFSLTIPRGNKVDNQHDIMKAKVNQLSASIDYSFNFSEVDVEVLKNVLPDLKKCKVFEYGQVMKVISGINADSSDELTKWKNEILEAVFASNSIRYELLSSEEMLKQ